MRGSRDFCQGDPGPTVRKQLWLFFFLFPRLQRGFNFFRGGGGVPNANFYRNPYNLWFSREGGSGPPIPLLDPHMYYRMQSNTMDPDQTAAFGKQTLWTQIRLLLREQSDLGPYCLQNTFGCISRGQVMGKYPSCLHMSYRLLYKYCKCKKNLREIYFHEFSRILKKTLTKWQNHSVVYRCR